MASYKTGSAMLDSDASVKLVSVPDGILIRYPTSSQVWGFFSYSYSS